MVVWQCCLSVPQPPTAYFWGGEFKYISQNVGKAGELYEGKLMKKWGRTSLLIGSHPEGPK